MERIDKLVKTMESLKFYQSPSLNQDPNMTKKEKLSHITSTADTLCSSTLPKTNPEFAKYLTMAMDMFFVLFDDPDSDVRQVADENMNRVIKCLSSTNVGRLQVDLFKEIKKNGSVRCVKSALVKFSELSSNIRPQKCRAYVVNLLPCLHKIARRNEESLHETLAECIPKLFNVLGNFTNDNEVKLLLKTLLVNAFDESSAVIRRTTALSLSMVCTLCRKPGYYLFWLLSTMLDIVVPLKPQFGSDNPSEKRSKPDKIGVPINKALSGIEQPSPPEYAESTEAFAAEITETTAKFRMLGVIICVRQILPHIMDSEANIPDSSSLLERMIQVYELCLHLLRNSDQGIVSHALETLHQLLKTPTTILRNILVSPLGIRKRHIFKPTAESYLKPWVACENITSDKEHDECSSLNNPTQNSAEYDECVEDIEGMCTLTENPSLSCLDKCHIQILPECDSTANKNNDTLDSETLASRKSSEENDEKTEIPDITKRAAPIKENVTDVLNVSYERDLTNLGNFCDHDVPLIYCVRHLTATFLLSKNKGELLSDKFIRVSLKALAIGCVTNALALSPKVFLLTLRMYNDNSNNMDNPEVSRKEESTNGNGFIEDNVPLIRDVANYTRHEDPQLRGAAIQLLGQVIRGALTESGMLPLEMWYNGRRPDHVDTINIITDVLRNDKSSITVRQTYNSLKIFVKPLLESSSGDMIIPLLKHIIGIPTLSEKYWLVKTEICRLMGQLPFLTVHHLTKNTLLQQDVVDNVLMCLLGDEDQRVRTSAASCFVDIVTNLYNQAENSSLDTTTTAAVEMANTLLHPIISAEGNVQQSSVFPNKDIPLHGRLENSEKQKYVKDGAKNKGKSLATNIFRTVDRLHCALLSSTSPHLTSGCFEALLNLSISYPPTQIPSAWGCQVPKAIRKLSPALNTSGTDESSMQTSLYNRTDIKTFSTPAFEILELCSRLLSGSTTIALDHFTHSTVMQFTARLFSGLSNELLKSTLPTSSETTEASIISAAISHEERLTIISNTLMTHCFKLLAIICHVIEDAPTPPLPSSISAHKSSNSNVHGNIAPLSPIGIPPLKKGNLQSASISINSSGGSNILNMSPGVKSFQSLKFDQHVSTTATTRWHVDNSSGIDGGHSDIKINKVGQIPKQDGPTATHDSPKKMGNFISNHHYFKIYEAIKNLNNIYKRTLIKSSYGITSKYEKQDILGAFGNDCNKMHLLAVECLKCLSSLLEFSMSSQAIIEKHTEELLHYLKTLLTLDPLGVLACVQSLLRCIFRTNAAYAPLDDQPLSLSTFSGESLSGAGFFYLCFDQPYNDLVHTFHLARDSTSTPDRSESALFLTGSSKQLQFSTSSKSSGLHSSSIFKPLPGDKKSTERVKLGSYIRLFEPMVIKALKHYTLTSDVEQQCQVLQLLIQLVKLRVNYCLLDSDQIFIGFVLKQLELIEEGQIANANILIPNIFKFLVLLSYEKYHSKPIIDVPKILQLCEGLFASGQPGDIYVVPAILPVAEDLFCQRTNSTMHSKVQKQLDPNSTEEPQQNVTNTSLSELDTQREVMLTMLLKVLMYPDVIKLVIKLLQSSTTDRVRTGGSERWRKLSRTVVEAMIPLLASQKIHLDDKHTLDLLHKFFASLAPGTLRPVDILLSAVLNSSVDLTSLVDVQRWLGFIVVALPILTNQSPEEGILGRLEGLGIRVVVRDQDGVKSTSPSAQHILDTSLDSSTSVSSDGGGSLLEMGTNRPEMTMAKFILQVIGASCIKFHQLVFSQWTQASTSFLQQELSHLLLFVIYMFQSGRYYRITRAAQELAASLIPTPSHPNGDVRKYDREEGEMLYSLDFVTKLFIELSHVTPFLTLQWFYILKLMKYFHHPLWQGIIETVHSNILNENLYGLSRNVNLQNTDKALQNTKTRKLACLNNEILRKGGIILFCDQLCDNMNKTATSSDVEHITWLVVNYIEHIVENIRENPVQDFVMSIHATSAPTSGLLLQAIRSNLSSSLSSAANTRFLRNVLATIDGVHISHSGKLIDFLVHAFLISPHLSLSFHANSIVCGRLELLLKMSTEEAINHCSRDEIAAVLEVIHRKRIIKRFGKMTKLLNKLALSYNISPLESDLANEYGRTAFFSPGSISNTTLDKNWFLGQTRILCSLPSQNQFGCNNSQVCTRMLASLNDSEEVMSIMNLKDFNLSILNECLYISNISSTINDAVRLKEMAEQTLIRHLKAVIESLPKDFGIFRPTYWEPSEDDTKYSEQLESNVFHDDDIKMAMPSLLAAYKSFIINSMPQESTTNIWSEDEVVMDLLARFCILSLELAKWLVFSSKEGSIIYEENKTNIGYEELITLCLESASCAINNPQLFHILSKSTSRKMLISSVFCVMDIFSLQVHSFATNIFSRGSPCAEPKCAKFDELIDSGKEGPGVIACIRLNDMFSELVRMYQANIGVDSFEAGITCVKKLSAEWLWNFRDIVIGLSRFSVFTTYLRIPTEIWTMGWEVDPGNSYNSELLTVFPYNIPVDYLQDADILRQYIARLSLLGWTTRQEFEEIWMCLLQVLTVSKEDLTDAEVIALSQSSALIVQAITQLLLHTMKIPNLGQSIASFPIHCPRLILPPFYNSERGSQLNLIQNRIERRLTCKENTHTAMGILQAQLLASSNNTNLERIHAANNHSTFVPEVSVTKESKFHHKYCYSNYSIGQIDINYILHSINDNMNKEIRYSGISVKEETEEIEKSEALNGKSMWLSSYLIREKCLGSNGLDLTIRSCLHLLIHTIYSQWLLPSSNDMATVAPPLMLLTEAVRSLVILSDLFYEESQFEWMLLKLNDIQRNHPIEDEIMHSVLRIGICKALSVLGHADQDIIDRNKKMMDVALKSNNISQQTSCLHSLLYLLQSRSHASKSSENDLKSTFLPLVADYLRVALPLSSPVNNPEAQTLVSESFLGTLWSITFHVMENSLGKSAWTTSGSYISWYKETLHLAINVIKTSISSSQSHGLYLTLISGLQRLVTSNALSNIRHNESKVHCEEGNEFQYCRQQILRLVTDLLTESNPIIIIPALQLFLSCIYSDIPNNRKASNILVSSSDNGGVDSAENTIEFGLCDDPELLMQTMEQISIIFDCVRRSNSKVAELLCYDVLPSMLLDFFPAADVINRVINEFISPGQPHQVMLAWVLFEVFKHGANQNQTNMLQEWVLMALPNFTKRSPISHSIWCLTVFFISAAANNAWLQAMFPYLQQRYGYYQNEDKKLFCVAAKHFYNNLSDKLHKQKFIDTFELVSHPQTPYYDLLKSL